jgi:ribosomal protein S18 acetylase RimI-like enzyme
VGIVVREARASDVDGCIDVLAALPDYFTPDTHDLVRVSLRTQRAWVAVEAGVVVGFVLVEGRYSGTAEITYAAVRPERRGQGIGSALVDEVFRALAEAGVAIVEVKTLDASAGYEPYVATRAFWERCGFRQIDCIDPHPGWQPGNPAGVYVAALAPTRRG